MGCKSLSLVRQPARLGESLFKGEAYMLPPVSAESIMKINQLQLNAKTGLDSLKLLVGQQLSAKVLDVSDTNVKLDIKGQSLLAKTNIALTQGQVIQVRVGQDDNQIKLIVQPSIQKSHATETSFLRQLLPNSMNLHLALTQLASPAQLSSLPPAVQAQISLIINQILRLDSRLQSSELKRSVEQSGMFFESNVKSKRTGFEKDVKARLFKLQELLVSNQSSGSKAPSIAQALGLVGHAINKISLGQLVHYQNPDTLSLILPFQMEGRSQDLVFELMHEEEQQKKWQLKFGMDFKDDQLSCILSYELETNCFDCKIYMEKEEGVKLVEANLTILKDMFKNAGLNLTRLCVHQGKASFDEFQPMSGLVDITV